MNPQWKMGLLANWQTCETMLMHPQSFFETAPQQRRLQDHNEIVPRNAKRPMIPLDWDRVGLRNLTRGAWPYQYQSEILLLPRQRGAQTEELVPEQLTTQFEVPVEPQEKQTNSENNVLFQNLGFDSRSTNTAGLQSVAAQSVAVAGERKDSTVPSPAVRPGPNRSGSLPEDE